METTQPPPDVFLSTRKMRRVLTALADKWTILVIYALADETKRFSQLKRELKGISQKMLTQTLRKLEQYQLVIRTVHAAVPPMVEYTLTPIGKSLIKPLTSFSRWADAYMRAVEAKTSK
jgi:DNA-binding HxlR family transcriptional regulator